MSRVTLAQLQAFQSICRFGTFQAAAEHLNVTQPTVSLRIRDLESALGKRLFQRRGKSVKLSADGRIMLQYVEQGLGLFAEMEERLRSGDPLQGTLRIGTSNVFAWTCLPAIIATLERTYPRLKVELNTANSVQLTDMLDANRLDIAFLAMPDARTHLIVERLGDSDIAWVSGAASPLKSMMVRPQDIIDQNILTASPPSLLSRVIIDWFAAENLPAPPLSICNNVAIIAKLVTSGVAISAIPVCMVHDEIESGAIIRYNQRVPFKTLRISAAYQSSARGAGMNAVIRIARSVVEQSGVYRPPS
jgi:DNA-binding transcriptional LysR family regulator